MRRRSLEQELRDLLENPSDVRATVANLSREIAETAFARWRDAGFPIKLYVATAPGRQWVVLDEEEPLPEGYTYLTPQSLPRNLDRFQLTRWIEKHMEGVPIL